MLIHKGCGGEIHVTVMFLGVENDGSPAGTMVNEVTYECQECLEEWDGLGASFNNDNYFEPEEE